jgi:hypothetical protein
MSESFESSLQSRTFIPIVPARSRDAIRQSRPSRPTQLPVKRSVIACAFLLLYLAAYMGVGYVGITVAEKAWLTLFR